MNYLKEHRKFVAAQFGVIGLHKHCLEIQEQAEQRKHNTMAAVRKIQPIRSQRVTNPPTLLTELLSVSIVAHLFDNRNAFLRFFAKKFTKNFR